MRVTSIVGIGAAALVSGLAHAGPAEEADALVKKGKASAAVALLEKAAEKEPSDCEISRALGDAHFAAKDPDLGAMTHERFLKACADHKDAKRVASALASHYDQKLGPESKPEVGTQELYRVPLPPRQTIGGRTEDDACAYERDARVDRLTKVEEAIEQMRIGEYKKAARMLRDHLRDEPGDVQGWRFLGTAFAELEDVPGALDAYDKYLELEPTAPDAEKIRKSLKKLRK